jgi:hypothetical protein
MKCGPSFPEITKVPAREPDPYSECLKRQRQIYREKYAGQPEQSLMDLASAWRFSTSKGASRFLIGS